MWQKYLLYKIQSLLPPIMVYQVIKQPRHTRSYPRTSSQNLPLNVDRHTIVLLTTQDWHHSEPQRVSPLNDIRYRPSDELQALQIREVEH